MVDFDNVEVSFVEPEQLIDSMYDPRGMIYGGVVVDLYNLEYDEVAEIYIPGSYSKYRNEGRSRPRKDTYPFQKLGYDNRYPFMLLDLFQQSSLHNRARKASVNIALGRGLRSKGEDGENFLNWLRTKGVNDKYARAYLDQLVAYGGVYNYLTFVGSKEQSTGLNKPFLSNVKVQKYFQYRIGKREAEGPYEGEVLYFWYHPNYDCRRLNKTKLKGVPVYRSIDEVEVLRTDVEDFDNIKNYNWYLVSEDKKTPYYDSDEGLNIKNFGRYIYLNGDISDRSHYYPEAAYESNGAIDSIRVNEFIQAFDLAGLQNGLTASYIVTIPLADTSRRNKKKYEEAKSKALQKIKTELQGAENNGQLLVLFKDPRDSGAGIEISEIPHTNNSAMKTDIDKRARETILTSWGVPDGRIVGAPASGNAGFANQAEVLRTAEEAWYNMTIYPQFVKLFEDDINKGPLKEIYLYETGLTESDGEVYLERNHIFKEEPDPSILLAYFPPSRILKRYGEHPLSDAEKKELIISKQDLAESEILKKSSKSNNAESENNLQVNLAMNMITSLREQVQELKNKIEEAKI